jgi:hypothetical protein
MLRYVIWWTIADVSEAVLSDTPWTTFPTTQQNIPEDLHLYQDRCGNLKYCIFAVVSFGTLGVNVGTYGVKSVAP